MKWREVKFLCAGMCVCTVIASVNAGISDTWREYEEVTNTGNEVGYRLENEEVNKLPSQETVSWARRDMTSQVGEGFDSSILGEPRSVYEMDDGCEYVNIDPETAFAQTTNLEQADLQETEQFESNLIIADVTNYVNVRSLPSEEGEILGKLYDDSVGRKIGEENGWYQIESGRVTGYVKSDYVLTGEAAEIRAREVGTRLAEVTTTTLKVRKEPTTESAVLGLVPIEDVLNVLEEVEGWVKVDFEDGNGYVSIDYVRVYTENVEAESKEEEEARLKKEEEERKKAEEAAKKALAAQQAANKPSGKPGNSNKPGNGTSLGVASTKPGTSSNSNSESQSGSSDTSGLGRKIADYALKFLGNPYVYGGTSLTDGADCSGFVQSIYKHFGISLPRTSGEQGKSGRAIDGVANAKPGDLVWYSGHIGIYIGNEQIVHASSPKNGIIISNVYYRKILGIRRII